MANDPLDLWPDSIRAEQMTPVAIFRLQARHLQTRTAGRLMAEVISDAHGVSDEPEYVPSGEEVVHKFEIVAPHLDNFRYQMFECRHDSRLVYPVYFDDDNALDSVDTICPTQETLLRTIQKLFASPKNLGAISSLLARIAESQVSAVTA